MAASERDDAHWDEGDRLWRACRHDLGDAIQALAGIQADEHCVGRLRKNWEQLGELVELGEQAIRDDIDQDLEGGL
jgi:hypothetical protein